MREYIKLQSKLQCRDEGKLSQDELGRLKLPPRGRFAGEGMSRCRMNGGSNARTGRRNLWMRSRPLSETIDRPGKVPLWRRYVKRTDEKFTNKYSRKQSCIMRAMIT